MIYAKHSDSASYVTIPDQEMGESITGIGAKAFLSHKEIYKLTLPKTICHIDDWAFAHMHNLSELTLPANSIVFGKKVFLDCSSLKQIHLYPDTSGNSGLPFFLASAVTIFNHINLLDLPCAAHKDTHPDWMLAYDQQLMSYLSAEDTSGFEPIFYGWFNDEDADTCQLPKYLQKQREHKTYLCFLRLKYDLHLSEADRQTLYNYLKDHMPWGAKASEHTAVWDLLPVYFTDDVNYPRILEDAGILNPDTVPKLIRHLPHAGAEVIAYLLRFQEKYTKDSDFFENFSL